MKVRITRGTARQLLVLPFSFTAPAGARSQDAPVVPRLTGGVVLAGASGEPAFAAPPSQCTGVRIAHDDGTHF